VPSGPDVTPAVVPFTAPSGPAAEGSGSNGSAAGSRKPHR
jgi:hypothetical protein